MLSNCICTALQTQALAKKFTEADPANKLLQCQLYMVIKYHSNWWHIWPEVSVHKKNKTIFEMITQVYTHLVVSTFSTDLD